MLFCLSLLWRDATGARLTKLACKEQRLLCIFLLGSFSKILMWCYFFHTDINFCGRVMKMLNVLWFLWTGRSFGSLSETWKISSCFSGGLPYFCRRRYILGCKMCLNESLELFIMDILIYIYLLEAFMWTFGNWCRAFQKLFFFLCTCLNMQCRCILSLNFTTN